MNDPLLATTPTTGVHVRPPRPGTGVWWDVCGENVTDGADAAALVWELLGRVQPYGGHGFRCWWGAPVTGDRRTGSVLQVDIDGDAGRAALCWLPTNEIGVDPDVAPHHQDITVTVTSDEAPIHVAAAHARVTPGTAIAAIAEYVDTGQKPTRVTWIPPTEA